MKRIELEMEVETLFNKKRDEIKKMMNCCFTMSDEIDEEIVRFNYINMMSFIEYFFVPRFRSIATEFCNEKIPNFKDAINRDTQNMDIVSFYLYISNLPIDLSQNVDKFCDYNLFPTMQPHEKTYLTECSHSFLRNLFHLYKLANIDNKSIKSMMICYLMAKSIYNEMMTIPTKEVKILHQKLEKQTEIINRLEDEIRVLKLSVLDSNQLENDDVMVVKRTEFTIETIINEMDENLMELIHFEMNRKKPAFTSLNSDQFFDWFSKQKAMMIYIYTDIQHDPKIFGKRFENMEDVETLYLLVSPFTTSSETKYIFLEQKSHPYKIVKLRKPDLVI